MGKEISVETSNCNNVDIDFTGFSYSRKGNRDQGDFRIEEILHSLYESLSTIIDDVRYDSHGLFMDLQAETTDKTIGDLILLIQKLFTNAVCSQLGSEKLKQLEDLSMENSQIGELYHIIKILMDSRDETEILHHIVSLIYDLNILDEDKLMEEDPDVVFLESRLDFMEMVHWIIENKTER